jgi:hypothetical protein
MLPTSLTLSAPNADAAGRKGPSPQQVVNRLKPTIDALHNVDDLTELPQKKLDQGERKTGLSIDNRIEEQNKHPQDTEEAKNHWHQIEKEQALRNRLQEEQKRRQATDPDGWTTVRH